MKIIKGFAHNIKHSFIGRITKTPSPVHCFAKNLVLASRQIPTIKMMYTAIVTSASGKLTTRRPIVDCVNDSGLDFLNDGDIVRLSPDGSIQILWDATSQQNALYITDYCNSACIMCPQKTNRPMDNYDALNMDILSLIPRSETVEHLGITGGEPTLRLDGLIDILKACYDKFPRADISLLTNGKRLSDFEVTRSITSANPNITFCIPLYAPTDVEHDNIVGIPGSFQQTLFGLYNLARLRCPVEIRVVIIKQNYQRLRDLVEFIYRNIPFVVHVALMGMECSGLARENLDKVWIDPKDYQKELRDSVLELHRRAMNVSVYNLPYCLLSKEIWRFSRKSISNWKNSLLPKCSNCLVKETCTGIFTTSSRQSDYISPIIK